MRVESTSSDGPPHSSWRIHTPSGVFNLIHHHKLHFLLPFSIHHCYLCFVFCALVFFFHFSIRFHLFHLFPFQVIPISQHASFTPYNVFFLLPLEVNFHTYLTTWLSSCLVGIFPRSHHIFAKIKIIIKVSPLKWKNLNSTHIRAATYL